MSYRIAGIDVHKKMLAVVVANVEVQGEYQFERIRYGSNPEQLRLLVAWLTSVAVPRSRLAQHHSGNRRHHCQHADPHYPWPHRVKLQLTGCGRRPQAVASRARRCWDRSYGQTESSRLSRFYNGEPHPVVVDSGVAGCGGGCGGCCCGGPVGTCERRVAIGTLLTCWGSCGWPMSGWPGVGAGALSLEHGMEPRQRELRNWG